MRKALVLILTLGMLLSLVAGGMAADKCSWHGPWPDTAMYEVQPDPGLVPGEKPAMSCEYWIWAAYPYQAPDIYWLQVLLNGKPTGLGPQMIKVDDAYMLPAEAVGALGLRASYSADGVIITITGKGHTLVTALYSDRATVDGFTQPVRVLPRWQRGQRYVSLDLLAQAFNLIVTAQEAGPLRISAY